MHLEFLQQRSQLRKGMAPDAVHPFLRVVLFMPLIIPPGLVIMAIVADTLLQASRFRRMAVAAGDNPALMAIVHALPPRRSALMAESA